MKVWSLDLKIAATVYVKAETEAEALQAIQALEMTSIELAQDPENDPPIVGWSLSSPDLPDVSLSPAMTIHGPFDGYDQLDVAEDLSEAA